MTKQFEILTKKLANGTLSRRQVMRTMAGAIAGVTLASWFPGTALARSEYTHTCKNPGTCSNSFPNCDLNRYHNTNCYCFQQLGTTRGTRGVCCCNGVCDCDSSSTQACICDSQANCATGYVCISNTGCGCTTGICLQKCNSTCTLSAKQGGRTAAGV